MEIYIKNQDRYIEAEGGSSPLSLLADESVKLPFRPICCRVNNKTEDLRFPIYAPKQVEYLSDLSESGRRVYVRALCFMLYKAVSEMFPGSQLRIEHSIFRGYFCRIFAVGSKSPLAVIPEQIQALQNRMKELADADLPFERHERLTSDLLPKLREQNLFSKVHLFESTGQL